MSRDEGEAIVVMSRVAAASLKVATINPRWKREKGGWINQMDSDGEV